MHCLASSASLKLGRFSIAILPWSQTIPATANENQFDELREGAIGVHRCLDPAKSCGESGTVYIDTIDELRVKLNVEIERTAKTG